MNQNQSFFEKIGGLVNLIANAVMMNALFLVACLPVVTIGAAWNALFSAIRYNIRGEKWFTGFKVGFKTRFWRSLLSWIIMLIPIVIVLWLDVITPLSDPAFRATMTSTSVVRLVAACLMAMMLTGFNAALILLNVYIPTSVGNWLRNAANMFFKVPLYLSFIGGLMWLPVLLFALAPTYFGYLIMGFLMAYFILVALGTTMLMKNTLLDFLLEARADGTLTGEEGKKKEEREEEEEPDEKEDDDHEQDPEEEI